MNTMKKRLYIAAMLMALLTCNVAIAQDKQNLNKEITLEKDVAPLEKKAVKKINSNLEKTTLGDLSVLASLKEEIEKEQKGE